MKCQQKWAGTNKFNFVTEGCNIIHNNRINADRNKTTPCIVPTSQPTNPTHLTINPHLQNLPGTNYCSHWEALSSNHHENKQKPHRGGNCQWWWTTSNAVRQCCAVGKKTIRYEQHISQIHPSGVWSGHCVPENLHRWVRHLPTVWGQAVDHQHRKERSETM